MKSRRVVIAGAVAVVVLVIAGAAAFFVMPRGPQLEDVKYLLEPRIVALPAQRVLLVEAKGDPTVMGGEAFGLLFKTYYRLKGVPKGPKQPAPRARWPLSLDTRKEQWIGRYAIPVPDSTDPLPEQATSASGLRAELTTWEYGQVAEILHVGPYSEEEPTIRKLLQFVEDKGYTTTGEHEEEYLKGPGMFGTSGPKNYLTIIRYRLKKEADERPSP